MAKLVINAGQIIDVAQALSELGNQDPPPPISLAVDIGEAQKKLWLYAKEVEDRWNALIAEFGTDGIVDAKTCERFSEYSEKRDALLVEDVVVHMPVFKLAALETAAIRIKPHHAKRLMDAGILQR